MFAYPVSRENISTIDNRLERDRRTEIVVQQRRLEIRELSYPVKPQPEISVLRAPKSLVVASDRLQKVSPDNDSGVNEGIFISDSRYEILMVSGADHCERRSVCTLSNRCSTQYSNSWVGAKEVDLFLQSQR